MSSLCLLSPKAIGNTRHGPAIMTVSGYGEEVLKLSFCRFTAGATDCKNNLLGVLDALEFLLENNFEPKRTILAGFGFDEEIRYIFKGTCSKS